MNRKNIVGGIGKCGVWPPDLLRQCRGATVKVWVGGSIYDGRVDFFEGGADENEDALVLGISSVTLEKISPTTFERVESHEFCFAQCGDPVFVKEAGYDCVWASFLGGYFCVYFAHP